MLMASPVVARTVDYAVDDAALSAQAVEQNLAMPLPTPPHGTLDTGIEIAPGVDHKVVRGGIICSAWTVQNPVGALIRKAFEAVDRNGVLQAITDLEPQLLVKVTSASSLSRCVSTGEFFGVCITRVTLTGSSQTRSAAGLNALRPFRVAIERSAASSGVCAGLTRGIGLISREAVLAMVAEVTRKNQPGTESR